ncbi:MAG: hypothetical protein WCI51_20540 [Lentisphaerota bacterium]
MNSPEVPAYTTIRNIIQGVYSSELEGAFKKYAEELFSLGEGEKKEFSFDGKVMTGSFDHFKDQSAMQFLSIFCRSNNLIIAHEEIACKTNEIPVAQKLITELDIEDAV